MVTRSSKQLSTTLQELRVTRSSARVSKQSETDLESPMHHATTKTGESKIPSTSIAASMVASAASNSSTQQQSQQQQSNAREKEKSKKALQQQQQQQDQNDGNQSGLLQPLVMNFNAYFQSLSITASLLPSLQAQYKMENVTGKGMTGEKAHFTIDLPSQCLSFITKASSQDSNVNLPPQASIPLPLVHIRAEFIPDGALAKTKDAAHHIDGVVLKQGGYLSASAEIGEFERCLTTDLLNHLVFVQKVFMKEINEVRLHFHFDITHSF